MENKDDRREWLQNLMEELKLDHRSLNFKISNDRDSREGTSNRFLLIREHAHLQVAQTCELRLG